MIDGLSSIQSLAKEYVYYLAAIFLIALIYLFVDIWLICIKTKKNTHQELIED
jgi:hypothetical protein